jgi:hypothetical protein
VKFLAVWLHYRAGPVVRYGLDIGQCIVGQLDKASVHLEQVSKLYVEFRLLDEGREELDWSKAQRERRELVLKFITEKKLPELDEQFEVWRKYTIQGCKLSKLIKKESRNCNSMLAKA